MRDGTLTLATFPVALRTAFRHASATRRAAENVIIRITDADGINGHGEACPRAYVTGESIATVTQFLRRHGPELVDEIRSVAALQAWMTANGPLIDTNPAAFGALETALLDRIGRRANLTLEQLLGGERRAGPFRYAAVLGDSALPSFALQALAYRFADLSDVKIKLSGDPARDRRKFALLRRIFGSRLRLRADANNLWRQATACIGHLRPLAPHLWAIEEPLAPGDLDGCRAIAKSLGLRIILDESACRAEQLDALVEDPETWAINIRVSKMGGILRSLEVARRAAEHGLAVIIGAHVGETSILTRAALAVAACAPRPAVAMEGAFGTRLLACDIIATPIMFGRHGLLHPQHQPWARQTGHGLRIDTSVLTPIRR